MSKKVALISGVTGQDGSYLAELLLDKGYEVHGTVRRSSSINTFRIDHIFDRLHLHYADLLDQTSISTTIHSVSPSEIYHLAAMSHVKVSFEVPYYTVQSTALGTLNVLESVRSLGVDAKIYNASSSEMFGAATPPQIEITPFIPQSPYACGKVCAHYLCRNYRESYGMFVCSGILFNHESICKNMPVIIENGYLDILPIEDLFRTEKHRYEGLLNEYIGARIWNGSGWTKIKSGTCYQDKDKLTKIIQTTESCCETTLDHYIFMEDDTDKPNKDIHIGDKLYKTEYPINIDILDNDIDFVKFIGFIAGDGFISENGHIRLTGKDEKQLNYYASLITSKYGWTTRSSEYLSGFGSKVYQLDINNDSSWGIWLRNNLYTRHSMEKRIPQFILNANTKIKKAFFDGYYDADGRKTGHEKYDLKGFITSSATLCLGLIYLFKSFSSQTVKCKCEYRDNRRYYYVQFGTPIPNNKGSHLRKIKNEVIKITDAKSEDGWFFDLQTESETFAAGPNLCKIHNSPRRGETFVTRKITKAVARIKKGLQNELRLGNLEAKRDWGYAKEYVEAMWMMLQQDKPEDYVIATGQSYSVKEFLEEAFSYVGLNWKDYVIVDPKYYRPSEVNYLLGDFSKARIDLGWSPKTTMKDLCKLMVDSDIAEIK